MKIDGNTPISLNLSLENVHSIITSLGSQPYDKVAGVIANIQSQTAEQLRALQSNQTDGGEQQKGPEQ
jgi:hypothetical protein